MRRVVLARLGGADADFPELARRLRDAGVEVVYTGLTTPAHLAATVVQEDPDAVAVDERADEVSALLKELDADDIPVLSEAEVLAWADTPGERSHHPR